MKDWEHHLHLVVAKSLANSRIEFEKNDLCVRRAQSICDAAARHARHLSLC
jgi:hypothetical protein